ncbi:uncharacterized protein BX664DRAFT_325256 [Halteromyces radiatus]|uniref:uncharacterized protein n=1 Tax=Halteromyces radiatus TaxID=101107 RepID=UPI0022209E5B|nr:uncharacterized protein BX664DRAFT_325256 [Halteromyces radiatus]KAI8096950.1 hypothetical protein BX664DRAFT_325256 [Halteromyces radiatus]
MVKKSLLSRILFRNTKKNAASSNRKSTVSDTEKSYLSSSVSNASEMKDQVADMFLRASKQKQQHLLSLIKWPQSDQDGDDYDLFPPDLSRQQQSFYALRLYIATIQKLKRHPPPSMENHRAIYHLLSTLVIQQEIERFEPDFDPVGRKPRKSRYVSTLLDTPIESITSHQHPVLQAYKRKPFVETTHVYLPSSSSSSSPCPSPSSSSRSMSSSITTFSTTNSSCLTTPSSSPISSPNFPSYPSSKSFHHFPSSHRHDEDSQSDSSLYYHDHIVSSPLYQSLPIIDPLPSPASSKSHSLVKMYHLLSSRSDPHLHSSYRLLDKSNHHDNRLKEDEDNVPLAMLKTKKSDLTSKPLSITFI